MQFYKVMARLLDYPNAELMENLDAVMQVVMSDPEVSADERKVVEELVTWMRSLDLTRVQQTYVDTFDMTPEHDLHLTHHLFGESRERGPAMVEISEHYKAAGLDVSNGELPDFLPLILEYVSTLDELQARFFLNDAAKVITVLAENLEKVDSQYGSLIRVIEKRGYLAKAA
jgi:nitrate reductase delta subunit